MSGKSAVAALIESLCLHHPLQERKKKLKPLALMVHLSLVSNSIFLSCLRALKKFMYLLKVFFCHKCFFYVVQILWLLLCCFLLAVELSVIIFGVWAGMIIVVNDDFSAKINLQLS